MSSDKREILIGEIKNWMDVSEELERELREEFQIDSLELLLERVKRIK